MGSPPLLLLIEENRAAVLTPSNRTGADQSIGSGEHVAKIAAIYGYRADVEPCASLGDAIHPSESQRFPVWAYSERRPLNPACSGKHKDLPFLARDHIVGHDTNGHIVRVSAII